MGIESSQMWVPEGSREGGLVINGESGGPPLITDITPESLIFGIIGDKRYTHIALAGLSAGLMQLMDEEIGAAVVEKEPDFFVHPWDRVMRSVPSIVGSVVDLDAEATAQWIRDKHKGVNGKDKHGVRYNALGSVPYQSAHYLFVNSLYETADRHLNLDVRLPGREEQLYQETRVWAGRYTLSTLKVAPTYEGYQDDWKDLRDNRLQMTPAAEYIIERLLKRDVPQLPGRFWSAMWRITPVRNAASEVISLATIGGLPEELRDRLEIPFSAEEAANLERIDSAIRWEHWDHLPDVIRLHKRTRRGISDRKKRDMELQEAA